MICPACELANAAGAIRCARCGRELQDNAPATMPPVARAVGSIRIATAVAPALALSDSDPAARTIANSSSDRQVSSSDPDATLISPSPFSPPQISAPISAIPGAGAGTTMAAASSNSPGTPGSRLPNFGPRYEVLDVLGQGGMGAVYKARDLELDRLVALKLLRPELVPDAAAIQRFKQELLLASKISHRNILRIHDLGDWNGVKFISMAYIEGQDLHRLIHEQKRLQVERALIFARQILYALDAAHAEGVVHRDLKPQNIMIGAGDHLYVMDFGLAKSAEADLHMTLTGQVVGTPQYMAPEQVEGGTTDHRADLYAFGLILDEMLTGDLVFKADSAFHLMLKRIQESPRHPREIVPEIPEYLERIIMRCLMRSPDERYQSAREILDDLNAEAAAVVPEQPTVVRSTVTTPAKAAPQTKAWRNGLLSGLLVLAVAASSMLIPTFRSRVTAALGIKAQAKRIAVLPLKVAGDPEAFGYIANGISDALAAELGDLNSVQVASGTAVQKLAVNTTPQQAAASLGVDYVVGGTLTTGDNDQFNVALKVYGKNGDVIASPRQDGVKRDLLTTEKKLFNSLLNTPELSLKASTDELARTGAHTSGNADAEDLYLQGRNLMSGQLDVGKVNQALDKFQQAANADPSFALAYTGIADTALRLFKETHDGSWATKAQSAAEQAEHLNDSLPEVYFSRGSVFTATGESAKAIAELSHAVKLAPNSDEGYRRLGDAYRSAGDKVKGSVDLAISAYKKAIDLNPYYWFNWNVLGTAYMAFGQNQNAIQQFQHVLQLDKNNDAAYRNLGVAYFQLGDFDKAVANLKQSITIKETATGYSNLGTALFYQKNYEESVKSFEKAVKLDRRETILGNLADAYRWSKQTSNATSTYEAAIAACQKTLQVNPNDAVVLARMGGYYAKKGSANLGLQTVSRAAQMAPENVDVIYTLAVTEAIAGQDQEAVATLKQALQKGFPALQARNDPEFAHLQSRPDFTSLTSK